LFGCMFMITLLAGWSLYRSFGNNKNKHISWQHDSKCRREYREI
jgi:hypothetical protein